MKGGRIKRSQSTRERKQHVLLYCASSSAQQNEKHSGGINAIHHHDHESLWNVTVAIVLVTVVVAPFAIIIDL